MQALRTLQPTASTVSYTVSTRPLPRTVPARALYHAGILLRVGVALATGLLFWAKWRIASEKLSPYEAWVLALLKSWQLDRFVEAGQWRHLVPAAFVVLFLVLKRNYTGTLAYFICYSTLALTT